MPPRSLSAGGEEGRALRGFLRGTRRRAAAVPAEAAFVPDGPALAASGAFPPPGDVHSIRGAQARGPGSQSWEIHPQQTSHSRLSRLALSGPQVPGPETSPSPLLPALPGSASTSGEHAAASRSPVTSRHYRSAIGVL